MNRVQIRVLSERIAREEEGEEEKMLSLVSDDVCGSLLPSN
jgi:hypothetical protein